MAAVEPHIVTALGIGALYTELSEGTMTAPGSRHGIMHVRNFGDADLVLTVRIADFLGNRAVETIVPPAAARFVALDESLVDPVARVIVYTVTGDVSHADATVLSRA